MTTQQIVAGAIADLVGYLTTLPEPLVVWGGAEAPLTHEKVLKWAESRGLAMEGADVMGWQEAVKPKGRMLLPGEELKCRIAEALGYDLDRHDITRMVITMEAGSANPITVEVTDVTKLDYEHDMTQEIRLWELGPALKHQTGEPIARWLPEEQMYRPVREEAAHE